VVSDALPWNHLPKPTLPGHWFTPLEEVDRKVIKKQRWLPRENLSWPVAEWLRVCKTSAQLPGTEPQTHPQPHNSISRASGTTGTGRFAPYAMSQLWYGSSPSASDSPVSLDIYVALDEARLSQDELKNLFKDIGDFGFGRDASIGLGKFEISRIEADAFP
jgi:CRISPR-associated protein Csm4